MRLEPGTGSSTGSIIPTVDRPCNARRSAVRAEQPGRRPPRGGGTAQTPPLREWQKSGRMGVQDLPDSVRATRVNSMQAADPARARKAPGQDAFPFIFSRKTEKNLERIGVSNSRHSWCATSCFHGQWRNFPDWCRRTNGLQCDGRHRGTLRSGRYRAWDARGRAPAVKVLWTAEERSETGRSGETTCAKSQTTFSHDHLIIVTS